MSAKEIVSWFEKDMEARKRLAELLVSEPGVRLAVINAVIRDVATKKDIEELRKEMISLNNATKQDIDELRKEMKQDISDLRKEMKHDIDELRKEVHSNFKWTIGVILTVWGATVIPILMKLVGFI